MKVLHVLYQSIPNSKGSSIRSRDIVTSQLQLGLEVVVVTSPFQNPVTPGAESEIVEGVKYYRSYNGNPDHLVSEKRASLAKRLAKLMQIFSFALMVLRIAKKEKVDVIHAHATFFCGFSGMFAARVARVPFIYEVRSLWEDRMVLVSQSLKEKLICKIIKLAERTVMAFADRIVVINRHLRDDVVSRGVRPEKVVVVGNAVGEAMIAYGRESTWTGLADKNLAMAYIGSVSPIEGLDYLLNAWKHIESRFHNVNLMIVGGGTALDDIARLKTELDLKSVRLVGEVRQDDIRKYYDAVDVIINPRSRSYLSETVTPLKPLEAMAARKLVLVSNVGGMTELVRDQDTGILFDADNVNSLVSALSEIMTRERVDLASIVNRGYNFVSGEKTWQANAVIYEQVYTSVCSPQLRGDKL